MTATHAALAALPAAHPAHAERLGAILAASSGSAPVGTLRDWMRAHDGAQVLTLQVGTDGRGAWAPGPRTVDASRASFVMLDGSRRDYAGCRVIATGPHGITVDAGAQVMAYALADEIGGAR
jgi:hypothetical protein